MSIHELKPRHNQHIDCVCISWIITIFFPFFYFFSQSSRKQMSVDLWSRQLLQRPQTGLRALSSGVCHLCRWAIFPLISSQTTRNSPNVPSWSVLLLFIYFFCCFFFFSRDGNRGVHQVRRRLPAGGLALRADMQRRLLLVRADVRERPGAEVLQEVSRLLLLLLLLLHLQTAAETKNRHFKTISDQKYTASYS